MRNDGYVRGSAGEFIAEVGTSRGRVFLHDLSTLGFPTRMDLSKEEAYRLGNALIQASDNVADISVLYGAMHPLEDESR